MVHFYQKIFTHMIDFMVQGNVFYGNLTMKQEKLIIIEDQ